MCRLIATVLVTALTATSLAACSAPGLGSGYGSNANEKVLIEQAKRLPAALGPENIKKIGREAKSFFDKVTGAEPTATAPAKTPTPTTPATK